MQPVLQNDIQEPCSTEISIETQNEDTAHRAMPTANASTSNVVGSATSTLTVIPTATMRNQSYISPAFKLLSLPKPNAPKPTKRSTERLPKALSGQKTLEMFEEREKRKEAEQLAKMKRKEEREQKRKEKLESKERKKPDREQKKRERKQKVSTKNQKRKQKVSDSSSSDKDRQVRVRYMDSDDSMDELNACPGCRSDEGAAGEWIRCSSCGSAWHITCTGDAMILEIPAEQVCNYPFHCERCL
ncbi:hypothetical protein DPMN_026379 [Dreissena polymorpha]|uniref:Zinc finger PHD-type domain-containing protein n=1 Tax=Dreissena polymorpha TaxID=45954 RepID=A0A9D4LT42_DREPO|nr:hypothetical protein DPMN_026379 [Dreissena polymorpha]